MHSRRGPLTHPMNYHSMLRPSLTAQAWMEAPKLHVSIVPWPYHLQALTLRQDSRIAYIAIENSFEVAQISQNSSSDQVKPHCLQWPLTHSNAIHYLNLFWVGSLTIEHALHERSGAQVAGLDHADDDKEVGRQAEQDRGDEGAGNRKERDGTKVAEELFLLEGEARRKHDWRQQPVKEGGRRESQRRGQACNRWAHVKHQPASLS